MTKPHLCSTNVVALTPELHTNHFRLRMSQHPRPIPISLDRMASAFVFKLSIHHQGARKRAPPLAARTGMRLAPVPSGVGGGGSSGAMKRADTKAGISPGGRRGARAATKRTEGVTRHRSRSCIRRTRRSPVPRRGPGRHEGTARKIGPDSVAVSGTTAGSDSATCRRKRRIRQGGTSAVFKLQSWGALGAHLGRGGAVGARRSNRR